jgi:hypothetical protein
LTTILSPLTTSDRDALRVRRGNDAGVSMEALMGCPCEAEKVSDKRRSGCWWCC